MSTAPESQHRAENFVVARNGMERVGLEPTWGWTGVSVIGYLAWVCAHNVASGANDYPPSATPTEPPSVPESFSPTTGRFNPLVLTVGTRPSMVDKALVAFDEAHVVECSVRPPIVSTGRFGVRTLT